jgi:hypothetical protein
MNVVEISDDARWPEEIRIQLMAFKTLVTLQTDQFKGYDHFKYKTLVETLMKWCDLQLNLVPLDAVHIAAQVLNICILFTIL